MPKLACYYGLIICLLLQSCVPKKVIESGPIIVSEKFSTENINTKVLIGNSFKQEDLKNLNFHTLLTALSYPTLQRHLYF